MKMTNEKIPTRDAYGHALLEVIDNNANVIVLDADLSRSTRTNWVEEKFPDNFLNVGIAEQNLIGIAAGMAIEGKIPFATTYAIFIGRAYDQIRQSISFTNANVKVVATHAGLAASYDGGSHQSIEDLALMRVLPNMTILSPCDYHQAKSAIKFAATFKGPVYIRLQKEKTALLTKPNIPFKLNQQIELLQGDDAAILVTGTISVEAVEAAKLLSKADINISVINVSTVKPLELSDSISSLVRQKHIFVIEEHSVIGGLYEAVCSHLQGKCSAQVHPVNIPDEYSETGSWFDLKQKFGLTAKQISQTIKNTLKNNGSSYD